MNGINGLILLPDDWTDPKPCDKQFKSGVSSSSGINYYKTVNEYTAAQWTEMESAGAVFLPAAGLRFGASVNSVGVDGGYWSSSSYATHNARGLYFYSDHVSAGSDLYRYIGYSVRLVRAL